MANKSRLNIVNSIMGRWIKSIMLVITVVMFVFCCVIVYSSCTRYFNSAELTIRARNSKAVDTFFGSYNSGNPDDFTMGAYDFVESFQYKDIMEVCVIDKNRKVVASSGGFGGSTSSDWRDYDLALQADDKIGVKRLKLNSGEPVTAMTYILRDSAGNNYGAVRYLISMEDMYNQLLVIIVITFMAFILVVALMSISGMYFVSSIVTPVAQICKTTSEIAKGDFSARINYDYYQDEIGDLCVSINNMAQQLSEIDKMKNDFISTVSHEIRTPMTAIKGWGETLKNVGEDPKLLDKGLDIIVSETERLSDMVEELLDFSRMQSGSIRIVREEIDFLYIIEHVYDVYKQKTYRENKTLILNLNDNTDIRILGDGDRIRQVLINILDNAIKYTPENGNIAITVARIQKYVKISISDNGKGISVKDLPHIKEKFYKADNNVRGTGIGLAVADEIIKMHSGEINISSELGMGTTVDIILPIIIKET